MHSGVVCIQRWVEAKNGEGTGLGEPTIRTSRLHSVVSSPAGSSGAVMGRIVLAGTAGNDVSAFLTLNHN